MQKTLAHLMAVAALLAAFALLPASCLAELGWGPARVPSRDETSHRPSTGLLPRSLASVLPKIKAKSRVPVLLPSHLPKPVRSAKQAVIDKATPSEYAISLYYESDIGEAGFAAFFAAFFAAQAMPDYDSRELANVDQVRLAHRIRGFFRPVSCGGSCTPANLWWKEGGILYQIQLELPASVSDRNQERVILSVANSAILAGPR